MEKVEVKLMVAKETYELGQGIDKFIAALQGALANGWQMGEDLPIVVQSAIADLVPAVQGVEKIGAESKEIEPFVDAIYVGLKPIPYRFIKKDEQPAPPRS